MVWLRSGGLRRKARPHSEERRLRERLQAPVLRTPRTGRVRPLHEAKAGFMGTAVRGDPGLTPLGKLTPEDSP